MGPKKCVTTEEFLLRLERCSHRGAPLKNRTMRARRSQAKFCLDAGFMRVVEIGQYFITKDIGGLTLFNTVACREYTIPRDDSTSQPKGWIQGNTKIGPVLEVTTIFLHGKHGIEIRSWSLNKDNGSYTPQNRRCSKIIENSHNDQTFGLVYHDTNGQNHGPVWKTRSFLLSEICMVIFCQDYYGKGDLRTSY